MTLPRRAQVSLAETPYYHCVARCVRRAFLCGTDSYTGNDFEHRRQWLLDRLKCQAAVFAIDICAYAIMSNHYHLVLRVDQARALNWSNEEVIERWTQLFKGPILVQAMQAGEPLTAAQRQTVSDIASVWRQRLSDISWYMRCLNEFIARQANAEDNCTGRFWEGRFKSQALLDQASLLSCMAYVDLNPVRAGMARTLTESDFTSIQERLQSLGHSGAVPEEDTTTPLLPFAESNLPTDNPVAAIPFRLQAYLALVDETGRQVVSGKRGVIPEAAIRLLEELSLSPSQWEVLSLQIQASTLRAIGSLARLRAYNHATGRKRMVGASVLKVVYDC